jgi:hypothetical protein
MSDLVRCRDHKWAPAVFVCTHLVDGYGGTWFPVPSGRSEVDFDWLCIMCFDKYESGRMNEILDEDMRCLCMHYARQLQEELDTGEI